MSSLKIDGIKNINDYNELFRMFYPLDSKGEGSKFAEMFVVPEELIKPVEQKDRIKKLMYEELAVWSGRQLKWGTLTGVKPLKLYNKLLDENGRDDTAVTKILKNDYLVSDEKIDLIKKIASVQNSCLGAPHKYEVSVYIGIPFCPTRCTYCSFTSNQSEYADIKKYLEALYIEIDYVSGEMKRLGLSAETVYIGGGTPTTLELTELEELVQTVKDKIPAINDFEFTVEAGRPDTITDIKLTMLCDKGVNRISINPQTMKEETLEIIGRKHSIPEVREAFNTAKDIGFRAINTDLIAGLPGESAEDFIRTLEEINGFKPENITVHTLAMKKSSKMMERFIESDNGIIEEKDTSVDQMVEYAAKYIEDSGYRPYYIYRQKYMADNLENVGYAKPGTECIYNIRIMEEKQTVIAMGAGGSSKVYFPEEDRIERVINVSNYEIYIDRIDEMIERKRKKLFAGQLISQNRPYESNC